MILQLVLILFAGWVSYMLYISVFLPYQEKRKAEYNLTMDWLAKIQKDSDKQNDIRS